MRITVPSLLASSLAGILSLGAAACHGVKDAKVKDSSDTKVSVENDSDTSTSVAATEERNAKKKMESDKASDEAVSLASAGRISEAKEALERATAIYGDNHKAWFNLGQVREMLKEYEAAAKAYGEAARVLDDEAMYHYKLGKAYWMANEVSSAKAPLERAIQLNSRLYNAHYRLGQVHEAQGKPKQAAEAWTKSAALNPMNGAPFVDLGNLYIRYGKIAEALHVLDQGRLHVRDPDQLSNIYFGLGMAYGKRGTWKKSIEAHTKALQVNSSNLDALRQRGFAYAEIDDRKNAIQDLKSFVEQAGSGSAFYIQAANQQLFRLSVAP